MEMMEKDDFNGDPDNPMCPPLMIPVLLKTFYDDAKHNPSRYMGSAPFYNGKLVQIIEENAALKEALTMIYDKWEDGVNCYEASDGEAFDETGSSIGHAVKLSFEEENKILALIPAEKV